MSKEEKANAVKRETELMTKAARTLHGLTIKRKDYLAKVKEKEASLNHCLSQTVNEQREMERKKRIQLYGEIEEQRQQVTSSLMLELLQICEQDKVPRYVLAIAKVLDNYQGRGNISLTPN